jgi:hypothetical protein
VITDTRKNQLKALVSGNCHQNLTINIWIRRTILQFCEEFCKSHDILIFKQVFLHSELQSLQTGRKNSFVNNCSEWKHFQCQEIAVTEKQLMIKKNLSAF